MHSVGLTENYVVLVEFPYRFSMGRMLSSQLRYLCSGNKPEALDSMYRWRPELGTTFTLVHRKTGEVKGQWPAPAFFSYHHLNAWEEEDELVCDMMCYDKIFYSDFKLAQLREHEGPRRTARGDELRRYRVPLNKPGKAVEHTVLASRLVELPSWDPRRQGKPYSVAYGIGAPHGEAEEAELRGKVTNLLVKADLDGGEHKTWHEERCSPGEPVFVPRPGGAEDEGVVLSELYDNQQRCSFLLVLDARTFCELARARLPHAVPAGLHGAWWTPTDLAMGEGQGV